MPPATGLGGSNGAAEAGAKAAPAATADANISFLNIVSSFRPVLGTFGVPLLPSTQPFERSIAEPLRNACFMCRLSGGPRPAKKSPGRMPAEKMSSTDQVRCRVPKTPWAGSEEPARFGPTRADPYVSSDAAASSGDSANHGPSASGTRGASARSGCASGPLARGRDRS